MSHYLYTAIVYKNNNDSLLAPFLAKYGHNKTNRDQPSTPSHLSTVSTEILSRSIIFLYPFILSAPPKTPYDESTMSGHCFSLEIISRTIPSVIVALPALNGHLLHLLLLLLMLQASSFTNTQTCSHSSAMAH